MKPRNPSLLACMAAIACGGIEAWPLSDVEGPLRRRILTERRACDPTDGRSLARVKKLAQATKPKCPNRRKKR